MKPDVLVCNLSRLGDLLQTQPLIDDLRAAGYRPALICQEDFAPAAAMLRNVSEVRALPGRALKEKTDRNWPEAFATLADFTDSIKKEASISHVINITPTPDGRLLAAMLANAPQAVSGYGVDKYGFGVNQGAWGAFLAVGAHSRGNAPVNLADIQRRMAAPLGIAMNGSYRLASAPDNALARIRSALAGLPARPLVALQPGASSATRQWPVAYFRELGRLLSARGFLPILVGSPAERVLAAEYARGAGHEFADVTGQTDLQDLAALLQQCRLLVTNDTGTMHMAAGMDIPVLAIFLHTAQPWDTGPQAPGCCCLEPALTCHPCEFDATCDIGHQCLTTISPQSVARFAHAMLEHGKWDEALATAGMNDCLALVTATDARGYHVLHPLAGQSLDQRTLNMAWQGMFWRQFLDSLDCGIFQQPDFSGPVDTSGRILVLPESARGDSETLDQGAKILNSLGVLGTRLANHKTGQLFLQASEHFIRLFEASDTLSGIGYFWQEIIHSAMAEDIARLLATSRIMEKYLSLYAQRMREN